MIVYHCVLHRFVDPFHKIILLLESVCNNDITCQNNLILLYTPLCVFFASSLFAFHIAKFNSQYRFCGQHTKV